MVIVAASLINWRIYYIDIEYRAVLKEKLPQRENSGHFDVMLSALNDGKASDVPLSGFYGYNLR